MISKAQKSAYRSDLFRHLDGLVIAPTVFELDKKGIIAHFLQHSKCELPALVEAFGANEGYLNVALRLLCSQGWMQQHLDNKTDRISYELTQEGRGAAAYFPLYEPGVDLLKFSGQFHPRKFEKEPFLKLEALFKDFCVEFETSRADDEISEQARQQVLKHVEGIILAPTIVHLGMGGMFHKYFMEARFKPEEFHKDPQSFRRLLDIFVHFNWFSRKGETYAFTEKGLFFARRASAYGVTVSYLPTLRQLDSLIFGDPMLLRDISAQKTEIHVDRAMNVWGSGGAHAAYFKVVDEIVVSIFNKPIEAQPRGILDMGCGNGAFLEHLFEVIESRTLRGQMLDEYPLTLVGADFNETALRITRANLVKADIWAKIIWGDIGNPALLAADLRENYGVELRELLNVRTFLDHNRIWKDPENSNSSRRSESSGAFAFQGRRIDNVMAEDSLLEHFRNWAPYVDKFGLLLIELHTIPPALAAQHIGKTAATAYDATHGYSDQYIVEIPVFYKVLAETGLQPHPKYSKQFPNNELATVSVNLFQAG